MVCRRVGAKTSPALRSSRARHILKQSGMSPKDHQDVVGRATHLESSPKTTEDRQARGADQPFRQVCSTLGFCVVSL